MKTLYISDLDGTLLDANAQLSEYTKTILNHAAEHGVCFSIATARTAATVAGLLSGVNIAVPVVLMNGVAVYDLQKSEYLNVCYISAPALLKLLEILSEHNLTGTMYTVENGLLTTYYQRVYSARFEKFMQERQVVYKKQFVQIDDFDLLRGRGCVYFSVCANFESLSPAAGLLEKTDGLHVEFYHDTYAPGYWYMEVCSDLGSKKNAVDWLRHKYGFKKIVSFGDNLNDLSMFAASDECCAVENAKIQVIEAATRVIGANTMDGVAKWLEKTLNI